MDQRSKIAILGFGVEGKAMLEYLQKHQYNNVTICDKNVDLKDEMPDGVSVRLGEEYLKNLSDFEIIFRSPGIPFLNPLVQTAKNMGVEISSPTAFFMDQCPCEIIGVSGTKGKGTTSTLVYEMLKKDKKVATGKVYLGGNIGESPIKFLDKLKKNDYVVLELSSFQLQDLDKSPKYAVLLNTTEDHLDYHADTDEYLQAKENLLANQHKNDSAVLNEDYEYFKYYKPLIQGKLFTISRKKKVKNGAYLKDGMIHYVEKGKEEEIMPVSKVGLIGPHNLENILPAVVIAKELKVNTKNIIEVVKEFKGLPHRLELAGTVNQVSYYNDSFATTPETSMAAVDSFDQPTILIAGGSDKGLNYDEWATKILTKPSLTTVILIGNTAGKMEKALLAAEEKLGSSGRGGAEGSPTKIIRRDDLEEAILAAYTEAPKGGVVVMSPAAASFDLFTNYKERGETFKNIVKHLG